MRPAGWRGVAGRRIGSWAAIPVLVLLAIFALPAPASADTVRGLSWHHTFLDTGTAHTISKGKDVVVAVVDSGVEATHPDLQGRVLAGRGYGPSAPPDGRRDTDTGEGHGTIIAGTIAGRGDLGENSALGIAPLADILPVAVASGGTDQQTADGIRWAADHDADVMNLSFAGSTPSQVIVDAVEYALSKNVVVVAGAGNVEETGAAVGWPANVPGVIAVTGTTRQGEPWQGSSRGPQAVLAAPAVQIIGPAPRSASSNTYLVADGTSFSTAIVSGVAALVMAKYPQMNAASVVNRLIRTAKDQGAPGRDPRYGFGVVDPVGALTSEVPEVEANPLLEGNGSTPGAATRSGADSGSAVEFSGPLAEHPWIVLGVLLGIVALVVGLVVLLRRGRRRPAPTGGYPPAWSPPGSYPPGPNQPYPPGAYPQGSFSPDAYPPGAHPPESRP